MGSRSRCGKSCLLRVYNFSQNTPLTNCVSEVKAVEKYIKGKFARTLLSVLKVTHNGNKPVYRMIPLQDFTDNSDINWSLSIPEIDKQLYKKYGLSDDEIKFIEEKVKEMS